MPELPDLTVYLDALERRVAGRRLLGLRLGSPFVLRSVDPPVSEIAGRTVVDVLVRKGRAHAFRSARLPRGPEHRGTGCRFASALATELGRGAAAEHAVSKARSLVRRTFRSPREPGA